MPADLRRLLASLDELDRISNEEWLRNLSERKREELEFHDKDRDPNSPASSHAPTANKKYYDTVGLVRRHVEGWIETHARDKVFLDYACGNGDNALRAAQAGASLAIGIDISRVSIENCRRRAAELGLKNTYFVQADCEATKLPDDSVDTAICSGMLHHLDLSYAFPELRRILRSGGRVLCVEALAYNPAIRLYRRLTPSMRTEFEAEHILSFKEVKFARRFFDVEHVRFWHLISLAATPFRGTRLFGPVLAAANTLDRILLRVPGFGLLAWIFTFELVKREVS